MKKPSNKLLVALGALGLTAAGGGLVDAQVQTTSANGVNNVAPSTMSTAMRVKLDFIRAYPTAPAAARMAQEIAEELASMDPAARAAAAQEIANTGGVPSEVASAVGLADLAPAAVTPATPAAPTTPSVSPATPASPSAPSSAEAPSTESGSIY